MNNAFNLSNLPKMHQNLLYGNLQVADEQIIYCETEYEEESGSIFHVEERSDVRCNIMEDYFSAEAMEAANQDHSICYYCKEDLRNKRFYNHLFDQHGFTKQQCEMMKQQKRLETSKTKAKRKALHGCMECGMEFITRSGLNSHLSKKGTTCYQEVEPEEGTSKINLIVCPAYACPAEFPTYLELAIHVDAFHRDYVTKYDAFMIRRANFTDKASFQAWKKEREEETNSEFFLRSSQKVSFAVRTVLYKCLCSNSRGLNKKKCEQCPAFIKVCQRRGGKFDVVACFGHLGHDHPTETTKAKENRLKAAEELNMYRNEGLIPQRPKLSHVTAPSHIVVNQYKTDEQYMNEMDILMPGEAMNEEDDDDEDEYQQVIVDDDASHQNVYYQSSSHY
ncbi:unnamed protein product [Caenorhabditis brenneri]